MDGLRLVVGRLVHALLCTMKFGTRLSSSPGSKCSSSHSLTRRPSFADSSELCCRCCCCRAPHNSQMQLFVGLGWRFFFAKAQHNAHDTVPQGSVVCGAGEVCSEVRTAGRVVQSEAENCAIASPLSSPVLLRRRRPPGLSYF